METMTTTAAPVNALEMLCKFVNQRPGLDFADYGDRTIYRREAAEITRDRADFYELLSLASRRVDNLNFEVFKRLSESNDRLTIKESSIRPGYYINYITGQYYPTEYRPAANRLLVSIIWDSYRKETREDGSHIYETGHDIRKAAKMWLSRRVGKLYFN